MKRETDTVFFFFFFFLFSRASRLAGGGADVSDKLNAVSGVKASIFLNRWHLFGVSFLFVAAMVYRLLFLGLAATLGPARCRREKLNDSSLGFGVD
ncbi:TPA: hypothetical protein HA338_14540 [Methanosarcina acetivorans]|uniref:Uncharacterized protein n=2 Tax=Methanosarcina acetivorans TaxID=2214 RepID=Q8TSB2_METAC|nr:hypothetical protein [Methanosarcina acetivorans]AAM04325.1 predicted protein [Methanosarcina acetivorans C2A]HIH95177.1 hypothetical protein [Methanosarcina acetivorans]